MPLYIGTGLLEDRVGAVGSVLISWRQYEGMYKGSMSFVNQMIKMVGLEPLESSNGDSMLLPKYLVSVLAWLHCC